MLAGIELLNLDYAIMISSSHLHGALEAVSHEHLKVEYDMKVPTTRITYNTVVDELFRWVMSSHPTRIPAKRLQNRLVPIL